MSFSSGSSKKRHYKNAHHGSTHYQKKGLLGNLFSMFTSRSSSGKHYNNYNDQNYYPHMNNQQTFTDQNSFNCRKCGSQIPSGSKYCLQCGEKVIGEAFCMNCGEKLPPNSKFCPKCGSNVG